MCCSLSYYRFSCMLFDSSTGLSEGKNCPWRMVFQPNICVGNIMEPSRLLYGYFFYCDILERTFERRLRNMVSHLSDCWRPSFRIKSLFSSIKVGAKASSNQAKTTSHQQHPFAFSISHACSSVQQGMRGRPSVASGASISGLGAWGARPRSRRSFMSSLARGLAAVRSLSP